MVLRTKQTVTLLTAQVVVMLGLLPATTLAATFRLEEATVSDINAAFDAGALSSEQLTPTNVFREFFGFLSRNKGHLNKDKLTQSGILR